MGKFFSKYIGYPVFYKQKNYRNKLSRDWFSLLKDMQRRERWGLEELQAYQFERLKKLLTHAERTVPYYRDLFQSCGFQSERFQDIQELEAIPMLTKEIIREQGERMLSSDAAQRGIEKKGSSGSTGDPLVFYQDQNFMDHQRVSTWISDMAAGWQMGDSIARLWGAPQDIEKNGISLGKRFENWLINEQWYNSFSMSDDMMSEYHVLMQNHQPDILVAYSSSLYVFALFLESRGLQPDYPLKAIVTSAEVLRPDMREKIERVFNTKVFDRYGSRDGGVIAYECEQHRGLHVNMQTVYLECIGQTAKDQPGAAVITLLENYAMPFVRYQIGDMLVMGNKSCTCGRGTLMIEGVAGRTQDVLTLPSGKLAVGESITHLFAGAKGIKNFQFVQEGLADFVMYIVKEKVFDMGELDRIRKDILDTIGQDCQLSTVFVEEIPPTVSGKYRTVISKVPVNFG